MKIVCYYNKNLKMSLGKIASQVGHVCKEIGRYEDSIAEDDIIVVLGLRENKFKEKYEELSSHPFFYEQVDLGLTEIKEGTLTAYGIINGK